MLLTYVGGVDIHAIVNMASAPSSFVSNVCSGNGATRPMSAGNTGLETQDELQEVLNMCRRDMIVLWNDEGVRDVLRRRKIRLEEGSGL